jgi:hypothetical protein
MHEDRAVKVEMPVGMAHLIPFDLQPMGPKPQRVVKLSGIAAYRDLIL